MSVAHIASYSGSGNTDTITLSGVVIALGDICLVTTATAYNEGPQTIDWGSSLDAFTALVGASNGGDGLSSIWYAEGLSGTEDIVINMSAMAQNVGGAAVFSGARAPEDEASAIPDSQSSPYTPTAIVNVGVDDFVVDVIRAPGNAITSGVNQTDIYNLSVGGERGGSSMQEGVNGGGMTWTWTGTQNLAWCGCRLPSHPNLSIFRRTSTLLRM